MTCDLKTYLNHKIILLNDEYTGILQEILLNELELLNENKDLVNAEMFLVIGKRKFIFSDEIKAFRAWEAKNYVIYVRLTLISNEIKVYNDKINVFELLEHYNRNLFGESSKYDYMIKKYEYKQCIFKKISVFLWNKLKFMMETESFEFLKQKNFLKFLNKQNESKEMPIQIYRTILSLKPQQIVTIFYDKLKEMFIFKIYNNQKSQMIKSLISIRKTELLIPYVKTFLKLGLNEKLGARLLQELKIKLLMNAYLKIK